MTTSEACPGDHFQATLPNPFSSRFTRPGAVPPLDQQGRPLDVGALLARLPARCVAIEGPHGTGKTTLVRALLATAVTRGRRTRFVQVRSIADAPIALAAVVAACPTDVVAVDGWERLPWGTGWLIAAAALVRRATVVATTHGVSGLPVAARCTVSPGLLAELVRRLPDHGGRVTSADLDDAFARHSGNLRDALADLYDRFERRTIRTREC